ncbi:MAG: hypothetical protein R3237_02465 [Nitrosopumilaceae archaeon]|nr:hypothetical protein [Nitrosopumilaceae archaeon]
MGFRGVSDYVKFFYDLKMGDQVTLLSFANNEKRILKQKLQNKIIKKEPIINGIEILDELILDIKENGEKYVLEKYLS